MLKKPATYKDAGVDIEKGDRFTEFVKSINSKALSKGIGSFAGGIPLDVQRYREPLLLSATDGVGTKLMVAQQLKDYSTVGIDLVAMCVNDLVVCGAEPLIFLDYIACGKIDEKKLQTILLGIIKGCELGECELNGGETAEMPDMYGDEEVDLAGFAVGIVEKSELLPKKDQIKEGDLLFGVPSSGIHSNGLSLARKVVPVDQWKLLLEPTRIYTYEMKNLTATGKVLGAAHITGGGLEGNIVRALPDGLYPALDYQWEKPEIFTIIQKEGQISEKEMKKVFNMGMGLCVIIHPNDEELLRAKALEKKIPLFKAGVVIKK